MNSIKHRMFDKLFINCVHLIDHYDLENCPEFEAFHALSRYISNLNSSSEKVITIRKKLYLGFEKEVIISELINLR